MVTFMLKILRQIDEIEKRIEIFAPDELVKVIFDTLIQTANTHHSDAGKVYLIEVSKSGRINDGASGDSS